MLSLLLLFARPQAADTSQYSSPELRALIARAEAANAGPPAALRGYTARYEASLGLVRLVPGRVEGASTVEQTAGEFTWLVGQGFGQHQEGYRVVTTGVPLPGAAAVANGWIIPTLTGPRFDLFGAHSGAATDVGADTSDSRSARSPLGRDREQYYRFEGGDTITVEIPGSPPQRVIRVSVRPIDSLRTRERVFQGDLSLDPTTLAVRRIRGQFLTLGGPPPEGKAKLLNSFVFNAAVYDIVTTEIPGAGWVPTYQRIDLLVLIPLTTESWSTLRIVTELRDVAPVIEEPGQAPPPVMPLVAGRSTVSNDSLRAYRAWWRKPDVTINIVNLPEMFDVGPPDFRPAGPPIYFWRGPTTLVALRFNRVEGLYTGVSGTLRLRNAMPGLEIRGTAGYAWWPGDGRGGVTASLARGRWLTTARVMRDLDLTTKFGDPLDYSRGLRALFQQDNYDYVDRTVAGGGFGRFFSAFGPGSVIARFDWVKDRTTVAQLSQGPFGQVYTLNPTVIAYEYPRAQMEVTWQPGVSSRFTRAGVGLHASFEQGWGDLPYTRLQAGFVGRANWRKIVFTIIGDAGTTISDNPPTQQLFLIGGGSTMPGYAYNEFGGNVAYLGRGMIGFPLPFLQAPLQFGNATIPPIAPNLSFRFYTGYTATTNAGAEAALQNVGTVIVDGVPQPFSAPSGSFRKTVEIQVNLFGTLLGLGVAKPLEDNTEWTFIFTFAQSF